MEAIVYCSQTGHTAQYARLLSQATGLPAYDFREAQSAVPKGAAILFLSWVMAGGLRSCGAASKRWRVAAVVAVGMTPPEQVQPENFRQRHKFPSSLPLFYLRGGYAPEKLKGFHRLLMNVMAKEEIGKLASKSDRTPTDEETLRMWRDGANFVRAENLLGLLDWYQETV